MLRLLFLLSIMFLTSTIKAETIGVFYDHSVPQFEFAVSDIKMNLKSQGIEVELLPIAKLSEKYKNKKIVLALKSNTLAVELLTKEGGNNNKINELGDQSYALRISRGNQQSYWVFGGDVAGGMYGGLQLAEYISFHKLSSFNDEEQEPYIEKRGIKFNISLDQRVPSFASRGDQEKSNIKDMWDMNFWKEYLDDLARDRYNVLSFWTRHPFSVMIKLEDYPEVAIPDVIDGFGNFY